jgi:hypothetical protein
MPATKTHKPHELAQITHKMNIHANVATNLKDAFDAARLIVDERGGIVCITGCKEIVSE